MFRRTAFALASLAASVAAPVCAQTVVTGEWVALGDVAPVTGEAAKILLTPAPPPGQTLALDPAFVIAVAKRSGVVVALPLDEPMMVMRATSMAAAPKAPVARTPPAARQAPTAAALATVSLSDEQPEGWVLVLARDVERGARLSPDDLGWADPAAVRAGRSGPRDPSAVLGFETKRALKTGAVLQAADIKAPAVIRKGDPIKLIYASPGLKLSVDGVAQADAAMGEGVRVLNNFSKRTIDAQATGQGEARVMQR